MNLVSLGAPSYSKNLEFSFSRTKRNEIINLNNYSSYNYILDINGNLYQGAQPGEDSATVLIIGGDDTFVNEKAKRISSNYYISEPQRVALYAMMREHSTWGDSAEITCTNSDKLEQALHGLYKNYSL